MKKRLLSSRTSTPLFCMISLFFSAQSVAATPWLSTSGNHILASPGTNWVSHGVNVPDARCNNSCYSNGNHENNPNLALVRIRDAINRGANIIRIPLESDRIQDGSSTGISSVTSNLIDEPNYVNSVIRLVNYATSFTGVYVMVSMWHDPTLVYNPTNRTFSAEPTPSTDAVYRVLVDNFHSNPAVIYGLSNEPFKENSVGDANIWEAMDHAVDTIRTRERSYSDPPHLISIQGRGYSNNLTYYINRPISSGGGNNVIYEAHIYDQNKISAFLAASKSIPVIVGEYGPSEPNTANPNDWQGKNYNFTGSVLPLSQVPDFIRQMRQQEISYIAWAHAQQDAPNIFASSPNDVGRSLTCNPNAVTPSLTSFGEIVNRDLGIPFRNRRISAAINASLD